MGWRLDRGHHQANPMTRCRKWVYYHGVSARTIKKRKKQLTLDYYILTILFVTLAPAADLVSKAITLMLEGLTMFTCQDSCHQLILDMEDQ